MTLSKIKRYQGYQGQKIINQEINKAGLVVRAFLEEDKIVDYVLVKETP